MTQTPDEPTPTFEDMLDDEQREMIRQWEEDIHASLSEEDDEWVEAECEVLESTDEYLIIKIYK